MELHMLSLAHRCPGVGCAVCAWTMRPWRAMPTREPKTGKCRCAWCRRQSQTYLSRGGETHYGNGAKTLDCGTEVAENEATRNSLGVLNRA